MKAIFFALAVHLIALSTIVQTPIVILKIPTPPPVKSPVVNKKMEKTVYAAVRAVPEAKNFLARTNKADPHELMIDQEPDKNFKYYVVKMGLSGGDMFRTMCRFCVASKTLKVYYWDVMADDTGFSNSAIIPLSQWRQLRNTAGWQKRHTYKHGQLVVLKEL